MRCYNFATHAKNKFSLNKISFIETEVVLTTPIDRQFPSLVLSQPNRKPYVQVERTAFTES